MYMYVAVSQVERIINNIRCNTFPKSFFPFYESRRINNKNLLKINQTFHHKNKLDIYQSRCLTICDSKTTDDLKFICKYQDISNSPYPFTISQTDASFYESFFANPYQTTGAANKFAEPTTIAGKRSSANKEVSTVSNIKTYLIQSVHAYHQPNYNRKYNRAQLPYNPSIYNRKYSRIQSFIYIRKYNTAQLIYTPSSTFENIIKCSYCTFFHLGSKIYFSAATIHPSINNKK